MIVLRFSIYCLKCLHAIPNTKILQLLNLVGNLNPCVNLKECQRALGAVKALLQISEGFQFTTGAEVNFWVMTKYHEEYETGELMIQLWQLTVHHKNDSCNYFAALDGDPQ